MLLENIQEKFQHIDKFLNIEFESVQGNESTVGQSKEIVDLGTDGRTDDVQNGSRQFKYSTSLSLRLKTMVFTGKGLEKSTNDQRSPSLNIAIKP